MLLVRMDGADERLALLITEGADERPAPLITEGVADLAQLVRELAAREVGLFFGTAERHSLIPSECSLLSLVYNSLRV